MIDQRETRAEKLNATLHQKVNCCNRCMVRCNHNVQESDGNFIHIHILIYFQTKCSDAKA